MNMKSPLFNTLLTVLSVSALSGCEPNTEPAEEGEFELAQISGTVNSHERMALPDGAMMRVTLDRIGEKEGTPGEAVAEVILRPEGQAPIPFELEYNAARIDNKHHYGMRADIRDETYQLIWTTPEYVEVLTHENPDNEVEIVVQPVGHRQSTGSNANPEDQANGQPALL